MLIKAREAGDLEVLRKLADKEAAQKERYLVALDAAKACGRQRSSKPGMNGFTSSPPPPSAELLAAGRSFFQPVR